MRELIEDYRRRLTNITELINTTFNSGSINDIEKMARLKAKASEYRTFISELERALQRMEEEQAKKEDRISILAGLYYRYKKTSDDDIRGHLKNVKIVKMGKHAGGKVTKYYPLNANSIKKIKEKPRNTSLTFDAEEVSRKAISGLEVYKTVTYLCKSSSRFFLKPDIGEIFDAIDYHDLWGNDFDAICFDTNYQTLPNTDGEHHIMHATLLINPKARAERERQNTIQKLHTF